MKLMSRPVVAAESPSVYQSMYRSIFDRNKAPTTEQGKSVKRARNIFFVVLRHGHLMLYDDSDQLEVRYVISLAHHQVGLYNGTDQLIPDGELWIRRNAICLTRRRQTSDHQADDGVPEPFYLFSDNCSEKEDFYLALLQSRENDTSSADDVPTPQRFEVPDIVSLVQRLHSSEEHLQTRWFNGIVGRLFLALYKTTEIEELVRTKITKKIARVKKPAFLSDIVIRNIHTGNGPPYITNPRLKDLTVDGDCSVEMDVDYSGHFRLEIATKARIELGSRFKAREVDLVLAVILKRLEGHCIVRFKPPPSNRMWFTFEAMPKMEMSIEPIVSSRQITYTIILRAIESRIREVIAETAVLPHWDDIPFFETAHQQFRGGIWENQKSPDSDAAETAEHGVESFVDKQENEVPFKEKSDAFSAPKKPDTPEKLAYTSALDESSSSSSLRNPARLPRSRSEDGTDPSPTLAQARQRPERKESYNSASYVSAAAPVVHMDNTTVDAVKGERHGELHNAARSMIAISNRSQPPSPAESPVGSVSSSIDHSHRPNHPSVSPKESSHRHGRRASHSSMDIFPSTSAASTPTNHPRGSLKAMPGYGYDSKSNKSTLSVAQGPVKSSTSRQTLSNLGAATASVAKKWGWSGLGKDRDRVGNGGGTSEAGKEGTPANPIGRGRPLPPPGTPLPPPDPQKSRRAATAVPKRKPVPTAETIFQSSSSSTEPSTRSRQSPSEADSLFVVAAPPDTPASPTASAGEGPYDPPPFPMDEDVPDVPDPAAVRAQRKKDDDDNASSYASSQHSTSVPAATDASKRHHPDHDEDDRHEWSEENSRAHMPDILIESGSH
ncbi:MAG: hypothetical protein M1826_005478 [Phylliscum demangeonii]|nr:MAG: hypothetical protein M1826_005478 [Phylliscum demangeonii]